MDVAEQLEERFLHRVLGILGPQAELSRQAQGPGLIAIQQAAEGIAVAPLRRRHEPLELRVLCRALDGLSPPAASAADGPGSPGRSAREFREFRRGGGR